jgi:hypothetical protein
MVKRIKSKNEIYFQCESCNLCFEKEIIAKQCEDFCKKYKSCNLELIKNAIKIK